jgi:Zn ribbon nucleic-acid-binding protein
MSDWLDGYRPERTQAPPPRPVRLLECPKCKSDQLKVRSSDRGTSFLQCLACGHGDGSTVWKVTISLRRVLIVFDG